jgi:hypothetical protein
LAQALASPGADCRPQSIGSQQLPDDAVLRQLRCHRVAAPQALVEFYIEHMQATGCALDLGHSHPLVETGSLVLPPQRSAYFSRPDVPGRYIATRTGVTGQRVLPVSGR